MGPSVAAHGDLPFGGGAIGFLGYDLARTLADLPARAGCGRLADMAVGLYDWALLVDRCPAALKSRPQWQGPARRETAGGLHCGSLPKSGRTANRRGHCRQAD